MWSLAVCYISGDNGGNFFGAVWCEAFGEMNTVGFSKRKARFITQSYKTSSHYCGPHLIWSCFKWGLFRVR